jgi:hypothetical protein
VEVAANAGRIGGGGGGCAPDLLAVDDTTAEEELLPARVVTSPNAASPAPAAGRPQSTDAASEKPLVAPPNARAYSASCNLRAKASSLSIKRSLSGRVLSLPTDSDSEEEAPLATSAGNARSIDRVCG